MYSGDVDESFGLGVAVWCSALLNDRRFRVFDCAYGFCMSWAKPISSTAFKITNGEFRLRRAFNKLFEILFLNGRKLKNEKCRLNLNNFIHCSLAVIHWIIDWNSSITLSSKDFIILQKQEKPSYVWKVMRPKR